MKKAQVLAEHMDEEASMEKEYMEIKNALGLKIPHSYNNEQLLLIHPRVV